MMEKKIEGNTTLSIRQGKENAGKFFEHNRWLSKENYFVTKYFLFVVKLLIKYQFMRDNGKWHSVVSLGIYVIEFSRFRSCV